MEAVDAHGVKRLRDVLAEILHGGGTGGYWRGLGLAVAAVVHGHHPEALRKLWDERVPGFVRGGNGAEQHHCLIRSAFCGAVFGDV